MTSYVGLYICDGVILYYQYHIASTTTQKKVCPLFTSNNHATNGEKKRFVPPGT